MATVFQPYSIGIVAENKPRSDTKVNITPIETHSGFDGEVTFNPTTEVHEGTDIYGTAYSKKATSDVTLSCEWLPFGANRITAPDVRRGQNVMIYRKGETDEFYWRYMGLDDHLFTLETAIYAWSGNPAAGGSTIDINNCYYFEVSTHEGLVSFGTSTANGEPFKYTFQLNAKQGQFIFGDDIGTQIEMDSSEGYWNLTNADGTVVTIQRQTVLIQANQSIKLVVGGTTLELTPALLQAMAAAYDLQ